jgi:uncharacterized surface protein with fasciclin (FAS1) repeats
LREISPRASVWFLQCGPAMTIRTVLLSLALATTACKKQDKAPPPQADTTKASVAAVEPAKKLQPPLDPNNIVSIAAGSPDHTTLVKALQAADYVTAVSNPGPLTVFAPTDAAFAALPAGTVEGLLAPDKIDDLKYILKYHAATSVHDLGNLKDGQQLGMANGAKTEIRIVDGALTVNGAKVLASIRASNGVVHVIDAVLLPPQP